jgi:hypothetical protein
MPRYSIHAPDSYVVRNASPFDTRAGVRLVRSRGLALAAATRFIGGIDMAASAARPTRGCRGEVELCHLR